MCKYRIIEENNKFHVEKLVKFLFFKWYEKEGWIDLLGGGIYYYETKKDAEKYISSKTKIIHNI